MKELLLLSIMNERVFDRCTMDRVFSLLCRLVDFVESQRVQIRNDNSLLRRTCPTYDSLRNSDTVLTSVGRGLSYDND
jgi:hypothetical protein